MCRCHCTRKRGRIRACEEIVNSPRGGFKSGLIRSSSQIKRTLRRGLTKFNSFYSSLSFIVRYSLSTLEKGDMDGVGVAPIRRFPPSRRLSPVCEARYQAFTYYLVCKAAVKVNGAPLGVQCNSHCITLSLISNQTVPYNL